MKLTYYGYQPFDVQPGEITVLATAAPKIYHDLVIGLRDDMDTVRLASDDFELLKHSQASHWYGDPVLEIDLNKIFQRKLQDLFLKSLSEKQVVQLTDDWQRIITQILGDSYLLDVPLNVPETPALAKLVKLSGLQLEESVNREPYGILETLIKTLVELNDQKMVVLTNISHYLQVPRLKMLRKVVATTYLPVLDIEFSENRQKDYFKECRYHFIDHDFILW
ncbi:type II-A CRISPR-associated protein Csn2 [Levilactobacillus suantsaii]|uniref:Type II-A CRISPR-associated protein Csn2 n=1 Tax=Levilactobacillus suantsaii TaxID=2292255 RepID=A0A4Q0VKC8_9LACO|nr:type II-A CRISPR-associated protein Csn2 [Levilactobacillus suantsaii]QMU07712.1 type II-A CRISPR-associated protein Csn2 [Levilactobacillus suantsaii]RXI78690.1 type II-A CRISPR-associated protein Csn2 [Levilactobacillus suantsaii]